MQLATLRVVAAIAASASPRQGRLRRARDVCVSFSGKIKVEIEDKGLLDAVFGPGWRASLLVVTKRSADEARASQMLCFCGVTKWRVSLLPLRHDGLMPVLNHVGINGKPRLWASEINARGFVWEFYSRFVYIVLIRGLWG